MSHAPRSRVVCTLFAIALLSAASLAHAAEERAVPLDREGRILKIDQKFAQQLGWLPTHPGFREARLLIVLPDSNYVLETSMDRKGQMVRDRQSLSAAETDSLRGVVSAAASAYNPQLLAGQEGKPILIGTTGLMSLAFWGWALPIALDVPSAETFGATYMITAGAGVLLPNLLTRNSNVTYGMGDMAMIGATRGVIHGALLYDLVVGEENIYNGDEETRMRLGLMVGTSMAECLAGYEWARISKLDGGAAGSIVNWSDYGMLCGFGGAYFAGYYDDETEDLAASSAVVLSTSLAGGLTGRFIASRRDYSYGDAAVMRNTGWVGAMVGMTIANIDGETDGGPTFAGAIAGNAVGLVIGDHLVRHTDISFGNSATNTLSTVAGGLMGAGIGALAGSDYDNDLVFWGTTTAGMAAGFLASYKMVEERSRVAALWPEQLKVSVSPTAFLPVPAAAARRGVEPPPMVTLSYRF